MADPVTPKSLYEALKIPHPGIHWISKGPSTTSIVACFGCGNKQFDIDVDVEWGNTSRYPEFSHEDLNDNDAIKRPFVMVKEWGDCDWKGPAILLAVVGQLSPGIYLCVNRVGRLYFGEKIRRCTNMERLAYGVIGELTGFEHKD